MSQPTTTLLEALQAYLDQTGVIDGKRLATDGVTSVRVTAVKGPGKVLLECEFGVRWDAVEQPAPPPPYKQSAKR